MTPYEAYATNVGLCLNNSFKTIYMGLMAGLCGFLAPCGGFAAQLGADSITLSPASSGTIVVSYSSLGDQVSGLQFDLEFDSSALSVTVVPNTLPALRVKMSWSLEASTPGVGM